jgi:hypothetical protein
LITINIANATMTKSKPCCANVQILRYTASLRTTPASSNNGAESNILIPVKSTHPTSTPIGGIITSATNELTTFPNAHPIIIPIAISTTFPLMANC